MAVTTHQVHSSSGPVPGAVPGPGTPPGGMIAGPPGRISMQAAGLPRRSRAELLVAARRGLAEAVVPEWGSGGRREGHHGLDGAGGRAGRDPERDQARQTAACAEAADRLPSVVMVPARSARERDGRRAVRARPRRTAGSSP